jgi:type VI secretion system ImpM family protein
MMNRHVSGVTAFGKVQFTTEFVGPIVGEQQISYADWLDDGIELATERGGAAWREGFRRSGPLAFIFRPPARVIARAGESSPSVLLGVIDPSGDSLDRPFPFSVITELGDRAYSTGVAVLPVAAERFMADAARVCALARTTGSLATLLEEAERQAPPRLEECLEAADDFRHWVRQEGVLGKIWPRLFPRDGAEGAWCALRVLIDSVLPMRVPGAIATGRSVRLPLGEGGVVAATFWIDVVRVLSGSGPAFPICFWPADRADGELLVCLGDAAPSLFAQLWAFRLPDPRVVDAASDARVEGPEGLLDELERLVAEPKGRVGDLLALLGAIAAAAA